jgi:hypothetical protein
MKKYYEVNFTASIEPLLRLPYLKLRRKLVAFLDGSD